LYLSTYPNNKNSTHFAYKFSSHSLLPFSPSLSNKVDKYFRANKKSLPEKRSLGQLQGETKKLYVRHSLYPPHDPFLTSQMTQQKFEKMPFHLFNVFNFTKAKKASHRCEFRTFLHFKILLFVLYSEYILQDSKHTLWFIISFFFVSTFPEQST
jgi:hypothetical protein